MAAKAQTLTAELWGGSNEDILKAKDLMMCAVRLIGINIVFSKYIIIIIMVFFCSNLIPNYNQVS